MDQPESWQQKGGWAFSRFIEKSNQVNDLFEDITNNIVESIDDDFRTVADLHRLDDCSNPR